MRGGKKVTKLFRCGDSERNDFLTLTGLNKLETQEMARGCEGVLVKIKNKIKIIKRKKEREKFYSGYTIIFCQFIPIH